MKVEWIGHIEKGKLTIPNREQFVEAIAQMKPGTVIISVSDKGARSGAQNRYYWSVVVRLLSETTGYEPEEMHEVLKMKFNRRTLDVAGEEMEIGATTTKMTTEQFNAYIEQIQRWAVQELNCIIPDPHD